MKEHRSLTFTQQERNIQFTQYHRTLRPPTTKCKNPQQSGKSKLNDSSTTSLNNTKQLLPKKNQQNTNQDPFKSCDSQNQDNPLALFLSSQDNLPDEYDTLLSSQKSVRALKSLQNERFNRKASKQRSDCQDEKAKQFRIVQHQEQYNQNQNSYHLKSNNLKRFLIVDKENLDQAHEYQLRQSFQSGAIQNNLRRSQDYSQKQNTNPANDTNNYNNSSKTNGSSRPQSKSSVSLLKEGIRETGQQKINKWHQFKKTSMVKGERDSMDGCCFSDQSILEIPNEHLQNTLNKNSFNDRNNINDQQLKATINLEQLNLQVKMENPSSQIYKEMSQIQSQVNSSKNQNINAVRDSSPLKIMAMFEPKKDVFKPKHGSLSERQTRQITNNNSQHKMFMKQEQIQQINEKSKQPFVQVIESNYKQPKQGQKKINLLNVHEKSQYHLQNKQMLYQTESSPAINLRESLLKNANNKAIYMTQSINAINKQSQQNQESDFIHSEEEDENKVNQFTSLGGNGFENTSYNTAQSIHLPFTQALKSTNQGVKLAPKINNLNIRAGPSAQSPSLPITQEESQPKAGNINNHNPQQISKRRIHIALDTQQQYQGSQQRAASNFRNESLERILGDKAESYFDQIEKIHQKDYVKLNRSILNQYSERADSAANNNRPSSTQTPMVFIQKQEQNHKENKIPQTVPLQRRRQLTLTQNSIATAESIGEESSMKQTFSILPRPTKTSNLKNIIHKEIDQQQQQQLYKMQKEQSEQQQSQKIFISEPEENENVLLSTNKKNKKELPSSPSNFPSSVKDKIKNISQRIKQEIQKQEEVQVKSNNHKRKNNASHGGSGQINSNYNPIQQIEQKTQSTIKSTYFKEHFKKYLNADKKETLRKKDQPKNFAQVDRKNRVSNGEVQIQNLQNEKNILKDEESICKTQRIMTSTKQEISPDRKKKDNIGKQTMFQKRKQSQTTANSKNQKSRRSKILLNGLKDEVLKRKSEIECIIYVPNHPPEIFTTVDNAQTEKIEVAEVKKVKTATASPKNMSMKNDYNQNEIKSFMNPQLCKSPKSPLQKKNKKEKQNNKDQRETIIKAKLNCLLKETRSKIQEIGQSQESSTETQDYIYQQKDSLSSQNNSQKNLFTGKVLELNVNNSSKNNVQLIESIDLQNKKEVHKNLNLKQDHLKSRQDKIDLKGSLSQRNGTTESFNNQIFQDHFLPQNNILRNSHDLTHYQTNEQQNSMSIDFHQNRYLSQINDYQHASVGGYSAFPKMMTNPQQYQNFMYQQRQGALQAQSSQCQMHCTCSYQTNNFSSCLTGAYQPQPNFYQQQHQQYQQIPPNFTNMYQQVPQQDIFNNFMLLQQKQQQQQFMQQMMPQYPFIPMPPNFMIQLPYNSQQVQQQQTHQQQQLFQFPPNPTIINNNNQMEQSNTNRFSYLQNANKSISSPLHKQQTLGSQLENALLEFEKLDE